MDVLIYVFAAAVGIAALLASIAIWAPRRVWIRVVAVAVTALFMPLAYVYFTGLLSKPKPVDFAWFERNVERAAVLSISLHEGEAIYLWLRLDGEMEPRYYKLPWRRRAAEDLEDAVDAVSKSKGSIILKRPFSRHGFEENGTLNVEIVPPPSMPRKPPPRPPRIFNPRSPEI